jgi:hypothetical protein
MEPTPSLTYLFKNSTCKISEGFGRTTSCPSVEGAEVATNFNSYPEVSISTELDEATFFTVPNTPQNIKLSSGYETTTFTIPLLSINPSNVEKR